MAAIQGRHLDFLTLRHLASHPCFPVIRCEFQYFSQLVRAHPARLVDLIDHLTLCTAIIKQSINQSFKGSSDKPITQSINQSISRKVNKRKRKSSQLIFSPNLLHQMAFSVLLQKVFKVSLQGFFLIFILHASDHVILRFDEAIWQVPGVITPFLETVTS
jgi:hypothetical protein